MCEIVRIGTADAANSVHLCPLRKPARAVLSSSVHWIHTTQELVAARSWRFESSLPHHRSASPHSGAVEPPQARGASRSALGASGHESFNLAIARLRLAPAARTPSTARPTGQVPNSRTVDGQAGCGRSSCSAGRGWPALSTKHQAQVASFVPRTLRIHRQTPRSSSALRPEHEARQGLRTRQHSTDLRPSSG